MHAHAAQGTSLASSGGAREAASWARRGAAGVPEPPLSVRDLAGIARHKRSTIAAPVTILGQLQMPQEALATYNKIRSK